MKMNMSAAVLCAMVAVAECQAQQFTEFWGREGHLHIGVGGTNLHSAPVGLEPWQVQRSISTATGWATGSADTPAFEPTTIRMHHKAEAGSVPGHSAGGGVQEVIRFRVDQTTSASLTGMTNVSVSGQGSHLSFSAQLRLRQINGTTFIDHIRGSHNSSPGLQPVSWTGTLHPGRDYELLLVVNPATQGGFVVGVEGKAVLHVPACVPASVSQQPLAALSCIGGAAAFSAVEAGTSPVTFQWRRNGQALADGPTGTGSIISGATSGTLQITGVTTADQGHYVCAVTNDCGTVISNSAGLTICYANCDCSTTPPILNVDDFTCFINSFAEGVGLPHEEQLGHYANCDGSTIAPVLNVDDFTCFINAFAAGCP